MSVLDDYSGEIGRVRSAEELLAMGYREADLLANRIMGCIGFSCSTAQDRDNLTRLLAALYEELGFTPRL